MSGVSGCGMHSDLTDDRTTGLSGRHTRTRGSRPRADLHSHRHNVQLRHTYSWLSGTGLQCVGKGQWAHASLERGCSCTCIELPDGALKHDYEHNGTLDSVRPLGG